MSKWNLSRVLVLVGGLLAIGGPLVAKIPPAEAAPFALGLVAAIVLAFYAPAWMYLVAGVLVAAFPLVVLFVFGAYNGIIHPGTGAEGLGLLLMLLGALVGLVGGVAGFAQARKGNAAPVGAFARAPHGILVLVLVGIFAGLGISGAWATADFRSIAEAPASLVESPDATVTLLAQDIQFEPRALSMAVGELTTLVIENRDDVVHTFSYVLDGVERNAVLPAGSEVMLHFKVDGAREIHFFCAPHSGGATDTDENSMWGTLTVA